ncbi:MAG: HD domain-containing protein [Candidatus Riflebacteria bacterium]|nr:HD domain-containing protein [Candidatus Riflebacteria bacterium]
MKPLELSSVAEIWRSALTILADSLARIGHHPNLWFPWGDKWRGHDSSGNLPPTDLPESLRLANGERFAGRFWSTMSVGDVSWLISIKMENSAGATAKEWSAMEGVRPTLRLLGEVIKLECLLGLTLRILENRASEHIGHWDRVRHLALAIGKQLGFAERDLVELELIALLHDIGKVALPSALLEVSRPLSLAERRQVETHSTVGAAMIREIPGLERVADGVLAHHEAPDGSGYPKGLTGGDIPLSSLVVGVADTYDAMTHFRPYAAERTYHETLDEMIRKTGKYDHRVLWALQSVLKSLGILETHPAVLDDKKAP